MGFAGKSLTVSLCYLKFNPKFKFVKPYRLIDLEPTPEIPLTNIEFVLEDNITIRDLRDINDNLSLDSHAFKLYNWPADISFSASKSDLDVYCNTIAERLRKELNAERVFTYDRRFRKSPCHSEAASRTEGNLGRDAFKLPVDAVHVDNTPDGGLRRIRRHLTEEEASKYLSGNYRIRIVKYAITLGILGAILHSTELKAIFTSVWRCFTEFPDKPLALCAPSSVAAADLVAVDTVTPEKAGEMYYVYYNLRHQWFWASNMKTDEVLTFTTFDSKTNEQGANCCIHSAFPFPLIDNRTSRRESLEIRVIVLSPL